MHILLIHQAFTALDEPGGTRHHEFSRLWTQAGHKVSIIASPVSYLTGKFEGKENITQEDKGLISIHRVSTYSALHKSFIHRIISFFTFMFSSFFKSISIKHVDIIWGTSPPIFQSFTAWLISKIKGKPFLLEIRDLWPAFAVAVGVLKNPLLIKLSLWLEKFLYTHADVIVVNSPGFISHIKSKGGNNIHLIPNGADPIFFEKIPEEGSKEIAFLANKKKREGKFFVMYTGAHGMSNDLEIVLKSTKILQEQAGIHFVFVGDGKEKPNLIKAAHRLNLVNLDFIDPLPKTSMPAILSLADVCLAILKPVEMYKTTYPNKVFDYMACGKPIILAIDGVIREVIEKAQCGVFCPPGDENALAETILMLYQQPALASRMGENGRLYLSRHFNRTTIANSFIHLLENEVNRWQKKS